MTINQQSMSSTAPILNWLFHYLTSASKIEQICKALYSFVHRLISTPANIKLIKLYPNSQLGYIGKALSLSVLGKLQQVQQLYDTAFRLNQNSWKAYLYYGYSLVKMKQYDKSFQNLSSAITKNSLNNPISYIARAQAFCFYTKKNFKACRNDIRYAKQSIKERQNHKILYEFQIKQIQQNLEQYEKIIQDLDNLKQKKLLSEQKLQQYQAELTKHLNKAVFLSNTNIFDEFAKKMHCSFTNLKDINNKTQTQVDTLHLQKERSCQCPTSCLLC